MRSLDTAIQQLDAQITASKEPRVNEPFRESWRAFTSRWQIERDSWLGSGIARKLGFNEERFEAFRAAYLKWQADFQKRITGAAVSPPVAPAPTVPKETSIPVFGGGFFAGLGTSLVWAALAIGGIWWFLTKNKEK